MKETKVTSFGKQVPFKVTSVKYRKTRRGLAYSCQTNACGVTIENDGNGGGTYLYPSKLALTKGLSHLTEWDLEDLINEYEGVTRDLLNQ